MLLLIPGPVTTRSEVRQALCQDLAPWDNDVRALLVRLRARILRLAGGTEAAAILSQRPRCAASCRRADAS
jgi:2-aminoethylphosphonate-pyruvate transaminase